MISSLTLYLLLLAVHGSIQKSSPESPTYRAAVVELRSVSYRNDSVKTLNDNAERLVGYIQQAAERNVDIIVFPELSLPSLTVAGSPHLKTWAHVIPDPSQNYMPCTNSSIPVDEALKKIACAAEQNSIYVVVNFLEKEICSGNDCLRKKSFFYVTSAVFDRKGKLIARYRKAHLLADFDSVGIVEISTFDTDFGVTFGNIICFDIMYEEPLQTLTRKLNITDIIHPAGWISGMPFLTTTQLVLGWAYAEDINILSSSRNEVEMGHSGSGIYAGRQGIVTAILPLGDHEEMLVADVRKKSRETVTTPRSTHDHHQPLRITSNDHEHRVHRNLLWGPNSDRFQWRHEALDVYETKMILSDGFAVQKLKHSGIECEFQVNVTNLSPPVTYRFAAFDGDHPCGRGGTINIGTTSCAIVQCANDTIDSCDHFQNSSAIFNSISITATYNDSARMIVMPNTLGSDLWPLENWIFDQYEQKERIITTMSLTKPTQNLVSFGIWGRNFERDSERRI